MQVGRPRRQGLATGGRARGKTLSLSAGRAAMPDIAAAVRHCRRRPALRQGFSGGRFNFPSGRVCDNALLRGWSKFGKLVGAGGKALPRAGGPAFATAGRRFRGGALGGATNAAGNAMVRTGRHRRKATPRRTSWQQCVSNRARPWPGFVAGGRPRKQDVAMGRRLRDGASKAVSRGRAAFGAAELAPGAGGLRGPGAGSP